MINRIEDGICHLEAGRAFLKWAIGARPEDSVWIVDGLGILYDQQRRINQAVETQQQALDLQDASQEPNKFDQILTINEIGRLYRQQGRFTEPQALHLRALGTSQPIFPDSDIQVI
jgi:tetratricopeptide (TPR) repeat protein